MSFVPLISLMTILTMGLLITRVAAIALTFTGVSRELANFQARSAFTSCGFATAESEAIVNHPVRRQIIMTLMLLGNAGIATAIVSMIPVFATGGERTLSDYLFQIFLLVCGILALWAVSRSVFIDRQIYRATQWALARLTTLEISDYHGLLHLADGYAVIEQKLHQGLWVVGKSLGELRLNQQGVTVLGIQRATGEFIGSPHGETIIFDGDTVLVYGRGPQIAEVFAQSDAAGRVLATD